MMNRRQFIALLSATGLVMAGCSRNEPINPPTPLQAITPKVNLSPVWSQSIGSMGRKDVPGLKIVEHEKMVYAAAGNGGVAAVSLEGQLQWQVKLDQALVSGPAFSEVSELLYVGSVRGQVICLKAKTGEQVWKAQMETEVLALTTGSGRLFVRTADGRLTALDALAGEKLWVLDHDMPSLSVRGMSAPVRLSNAILLGWEDGSVEAILQENGERAWESRIALPRGRTDIERMVDVQASILTDGVRIYAAATNGKVTALEAQSGNQLWTSDTATWVDMAIGERSLFVVAEDDTLRALSIDSGRVLWKQEALKYRRVSKAIAWGKWVAVTDMQGVLHLLDAADGSLVGRVDGAVKEGLADGLAVTDRRLLLLDVAGNLTFWQAGSLE
ncbi:MAG: outer membrane protein assembly factor BamB [Thiotrichales bacterium 34-46-19]|nr:MAG: outer membrane protein assembly factor BamB [Thiotrichales bacterium 34-46-19]